MRTPVLPSLFISPILAIAQAGTVTTTADSGPGSLRAALAAAIDSELIDFAPSLNGQTILLTTGSLPVSGKVVTIDASTLPGGIKLSGNSATRVFTITSASNVTLKRLDLFGGRETAENGGALFVSQSQIRMEDCTVRDSYSAFDGGGLWGNAITGTITRCRFTGNRSMSFGGGMFLIGVNSLNISNSQISGNRGVVGGGIYNFVASPLITNCTIQGNLEKGIVSQSFSHPTIRNSVIWGNRASSGTNTAAYQLANSNESDTTVIHSLVEGASDETSFGSDNPVIWGAGNPNGTLPTNDPRFVGAAAPDTNPTSAGDLRFFPGSPLIDAGDSSFATEPLDLARRARITGSAVDIGAFEGPYVTFGFVHPLLSASGDANENGRSNFVDYALGFDPLAPDRGNGSSFQITPGGSFFTISRRTDAADFWPGVETSVSLADGSWQALAEGIDYQIESSSAASPMRTLEVLRLTAPGGPARFYRQVVKY